MAVSQYCSNNVGAMICAPEKSPQRPCAWHRAQMSQTRGAGARGRGGAPSEIGASGTPPRPYRCRRATPARRTAISCAQTRWDAGARAHGRAIRTMCDTTGDMSTLRTARASAPAAASPRAPVSDATAALMRPSSAAPTAADSGDAGAPLPPPFACPGSPPLPAAAAAAAAPRPLPARLTASLVARSSFAPDRHHAHASTPLPPPQSRHTHTLSGDINGVICRAAPCAALPAAAARRSRRPPAAFLLRGRLQARGRRRHCGRSRRDGSGSPCTPRRQRRRRAAAAERTVLVDLRAVRARDVCRPHHA